MTPNFPTASAATIGAYKSFDSFPARSSVFGSAQTRRSLGLHHAGINTTMNPFDVYLLAATL